jgi:hypothetical protein
MANSRKILQEGYNRLKKTLEKILKPAEKRTQPQYALQPIKNRRFPNN